MGAVANMRPDLFKAIVADVPFVDVINTMLDDSLPLTAQEWEQWGNPRTPETSAYMRSYSPYDNVEKKAYPWLLVTTSLNDSQVCMGASEMGGEAAGDEDRHEPALFEDQPGRRSRGKLGPLRSPA